MWQVDKSAKPPVCKIMNFNQEKYKRHVLEKERAKSRVQYTMDVAFEVSLLSLLIYILPCSF